MNFTFKRHKKQTGLAAVGYPYPQVDIKLDKKVVGHISPPNWRSKENVFSIRFAIVDAANSNCGWKWITLKFKSATEQEARDFIIEHDDQLQAKYNFHHFEY